MVDTEFPTANEYLTRLGLGPIEPPPRMSFWQRFAAGLANMPETPPGAGGGPALLSGLARGFGQATTSAMQRENAVRAQQNALRIGASQAYAAALARRMTTPTPEQEIALAGRKAGAEKTAQLKAETAAEPVYPPPPELVDRLVKEGMPGPVGPMSAKERDVLMRQEFPEKYRQVPVQVPDMSEPLLNQMADIFALQGPTGLGINTRSQSGLNFVVKVGERAVERHPESIPMMRAHYAASKQALVSNENRLRLLREYHKFVTDNVARFKEQIKHIPETGVPIANKTFRDLAQEVGGSPEVAQARAQLITLQADFARMIAGNPQLNGELAVETRRSIERILPDNATIGMYLATLDKTLLPDAQSRVYRTENESIDLRNGMIATPEGARKIYVKVTDRNGGVHFGWTSDRPGQLEMLQKRAAREGAAVEEVSP